MYWLFADVFGSCPSLISIERLRISLSALVVGADKDVFAEKLAALRDKLPDADDADATAQFYLEFSRLFGDAISGYGLPPPHESVQRKSADPVSLIAEVSDCYEDAGLAPIDSSVPIDHLGVECRFMAMLCQQEMQRWQRDEGENAMNSLKRQRDFLDGHLLQWVDTYLNVVQAHAQHPFYRDISALALAALPADRATIEEMLAECEVT